MAKHKLVVEGTSITINKEGFISLTDIAKRSSDREPNQVIRSWLRNQGTINYLEAWETVHNVNFKHGQMDMFRKQASNNRAKISAQLYIEETQAKGLTSKSGRYGGTFAHSDIALNFCYWLSPEFQVYFLKEFQRLKSEEARMLGLEFDLRREISKANYPFQTEAIDTYIVSPKMNKLDKKNIYSSEADLLNKVLFGCTAKEWKKQNISKKGNIRDHATIEELMILANLEFLNGKLIQWDCDQELRAKMLADTVKEQLTLYKKSKAVKRIKEKEQRRLD